jgi:hypothetical protein
MLLERHYAAIEAEASPGAYVRDHAPTLVQEIAMEQIRNWRSIGLSARDVMQAFGVKGSLVGWDGVLRRVELETANLLMNKTIKEADDDRRY